MHKKNSVKKNDEYTELADAIPDIFFTLDENLCFLYWNKVAQVFLNLSLKDVVGKKIYDVFPNFKNTDIEKVYLDVLKTKTSKIIKTFFDINNFKYFFDIHAVPTKEGLAVFAKEITKEKLEKDTLSTSIEKYRELYEKSPLGYQSLDSDGNFLIVNDAWLETLGYEKKDVIGKCFADFMTPEFKDIFKQRFPQFKSIGKIYSEFQMICKNGTIKNIAFDGRIGYNPNGSFKQTHCILKDITEYKKVEEALKNSEKKYSAIFNQSPIAIKSYDLDGNLINVNNACLEMFGLLSINEISGFRLFDDPDIGSDLRARLLNKEQVRFESKFDFEEFKKFNSISSSRSGIMILDRCIITLTDNEKITGYLEQIQEITEKKNSMNEAIYLSYHDQLTGLYNRRFFEEEIKRLNTERQFPLSLIMGDINCLKMINDVFGHIIGDKLLKETAKVLKIVCRADDILARWGGDEFVILLPKTSTTDSEKISERIKKICSKIHTKNIPLSISFGIATQKVANQDMQAILTDAEAKMYKKKLAEKQSLGRSIMAALKQTIYEKSIETQEHTDKVVELALKLGKSIKLSFDQLDELALLASLHDIGKVAISETILKKKGKLSKKEWSVIKRHPEIGFNIAQSSPQIAYIAKSILSCHEKWDGSGYPQGLKNEEIPIISRIISISDSYDVMTRGKNYKKAMGNNDAIEELIRCSGTQFDPDLINEFIKIIKISG